MTATGGAPRLFVGTYARNGGAGLYTLNRDPGGGWSPGAVHERARNASFGAYALRHNLCYLVDEDAGRIGVFRHGPHSWARHADVPAHGEQPCYVALDAAQARLAVANYGSGSVAVYRLDAGGLPQGDPVVRQHSGNGPVADRQDGPHAHCALFAPDGRWLYHVDLGTDAVLAHRLNQSSGAIVETRTAFTAPAGSGPRHLAFHPRKPLALLVSELASTLTVLAVEDGRLTALRTLSTLPPDATADSLGGHLALSAAGNRVYVTNRGHDSIAAFAFADDGSLELLQHVPSGGSSPRAFVLLEAERQMLVANEEAGTVVAFALNPDGTLSAPGAAIALPGAAFPFVLPNR